MATRPYRGVFPILPTTFDEDGRLDDASQLRAVDFFLEAGVAGFGILANYSEQFALSDAEREHLTRSILKHVSGRVPVIVTTSHYSSRVAAERSRQAQDLGAAMVMLMPPFLGTLRPDEAGLVEFFQTVGAAVDVPIMIQDSALSGISMSASLLTRLAADIPNVRYFKIEVPGTTAKLRELIRLGGGNVEGPFDGEEGITLIHDLAAGATGTMPGGMVPDLFREVFSLWDTGRRAEATALYDRLLPLIVFENKIASFRATKAVLKEGGVIRCEAARSPTAKYLAPEVRAALLDIVRRLDPLALRWAR